MNWIYLDELPDLYSYCVLLYSNNKISGGVYVGNRTFDVDYPDGDTSTKVVAWIYAPER